MTLAAGCGFQSRPGQSDAEDLVWRQVYSAPGQPPLVEWREDDCGGSQAGARYLGTCYAGIYLRGDRALVAWRGTIHQSSYAHELMHAFQWTRGIDDPDHHRPEWRLVAVANERLADYGL